MWAQIVKMRVKPGAESQLEEMRSELKSRVQSRPGLVNAYWSKSRNNPHEYYTFIVFESEADAREGERQLAGDPFFQRLRDLSEGQQEFIDLHVVESFR